VEYSRHRGSSSFPTHRWRWKECAWQWTAFVRITFEAVCPGDLNCTWRSDVMASSCLCTGTRPFTSLISRHDSAGGFAAYAINCFALQRAIGFHCFPAASRTRQPTCWKNGCKRRLSALSIDYRARTCRIRTPSFICCPSSVSRLSRRPCLKLGFEKVVKVSYWFAGPQKLTAVPFQSRKLSELDKNRLLLRNAMYRELSKFKEQRPRSRGINVSLSICMYRSTNKSSGIS